ncbi:glycosyltransferase, partial [Pseudomonas syringae]
VSGGVSDDSAGTPRRAAGRAEGPCVAVTLQRDYGQTAAILAGCDQCQGDVVITLDADLQNPPEEIPRLVKLAEQGYDVVGTVRSNRQDSAWRRWPSKLINLAVQRPTGVAMNDYGCMLRALRLTIVAPTHAFRGRTPLIPLRADSPSRATPEVLVYRRHSASRGPNTGLCPP